MAEWRLWTTEEVRVLKKMYREGHRLGAIAHHFGRSRDAIKRKLSYLNVSRPKKYDGRGRRVG
jgi:hypothetical protein